MQDATQVLSARRSKFLSQTEQTPSGEEQVSHLVPQVLQVLSDARYIDHVQDSTQVFSERRSKLIKQAEQTPFGEEQVSQFAPQLTQA